MIIINSSGTHASITEKYLNEISENKFRIANFG